MKEEEWKDKLKIKEKRKNKAGIDQNNPNLAEDILLQKELDDLDKEEGR